jgi:hypothetical protein
VGRLANAFEGVRKKLGENLPQVVWEAHFTVGHHSNGQDGCLYQDQIRVGEDCIGGSEVPEERRINKRDGSFSTNYIRGGLNYSRNFLDEKSVAHFVWGWLAELEHHPRAWIDEDIADIYGRTRLRASANIAARGRPICPRRLEAMTSVEYIHGHPKSVWPVAFTAQTSCFPTPQGGWGFFVRFYGGQDYYNLGFLENIKRVHVGATFNPSGFFRFKRPSGGGLPAEGPKNEY